MKREEELVLKAAKEVMVKFIETGRLSVNSFEEEWKRIHGAISNSLKKSGSENSEAPKP
ncbi:MAG: hypothetical protein GY849_19855 [Deltaproteobacteria bacterium]|nr:hypothetical protein [Deltaproteobacteria bacterium]